MATLYPGELVFPGEDVFPQPDDADYEAWRAFNATTLTELNVDNLEVGVEYEVQVRAVTTDGLASDWTDSIYLVTPTDVDPPGIPSKPIVTTRLGTFTVEWDGRTDIGGRMDDDFAYVEVRVDGEPIDRMPEPGRVVWAGAEYNTPYTFTMVAVDTSGNVSDPSESVLGTVQPLVDADLIDKIVHGSDNVIDGSIGSDQLMAASVTTDKLRVGVASNTVVDPTFSNDELNALRFPAEGGSIETIGGTRYMRIETTEPSMRVWLGGFSQARPETTNPAFSLEDTNGWIPVQPGQDWLFSCRARSTMVGSRGRYQWTFRDAEGNDITPGDGEYGAAFNYFQGSEVECLQTVKVPEGAAWMAVAYAFSSLIQPSVVHLALPKVWQKVSSVLIQDGAVTAAKIAALTIESDHIKANTITADKLAVGSVTASKIAADSITANKIAANSITTEKLTADSVTAAKIAANAIRAEHIAANTIEADMIRANALDGKVITGGAFRSPGRTIASDLNPGIYLRSSDGVITVNSGAADRFLTISPATGEFKIGRSADPALEFDSNTNRLTLSGVLHTAKPGERRISLNSSTWDSQEVSQISFYPPASGYRSAFITHYGDEGELIMWSGQSADVPLTHRRTFLAAHPREVALGLNENSSTSTQYFRFGRGDRAGMEASSTSDLNMFSVDMLLNATRLRLSGGTLTFNNLPDYNDANYDIVMYADFSIGWAHKAWQSIAAIKQDIEEVGAPRYEVLDLKAKTYLDRRAVEANPEGDHRRQVGYIAEEVADISAQHGGSLDPLLRLTKDGELQGLHYDRIVAYLIDVVRDMDDRLAAVEGKASPRKQLVRSLRKSTLKSASYESMSTPIPHQDPKPNPPSTPRGEVSHESE